jgi:F-type H+-transporting ATPase subunit gamma
MPNLKDIRRRIKSVKSTQKITQAMRMVAAAKVRRAEMRMKAARPYAEQLNQLFNQVYQSVIQQGLSTEDIESSQYGALLSPRPAKNVGIIVMSSDRGLCGAYNTNIIRAALKMDAALQAEGLTPHFFLVGTKVVQAFKRYSQSNVLGRLSNMTAAPGVHDAASVADTMMAAYLSGKIDRIEVFSTRFISLVTNEARQQSLIPVTVPAVSSEALPKSAQQELLLEPSSVQALDALIPMYLRQTIYILMLEATASELASRMTAMSNATNNAKDMIDRLSIVYNKARQASITQEILEVVSGAQALG